MAVSRVGGGVLAEAVKPKYGGIFSAVMQYGGNVLAVGGFSFFGGNDFGCWRYYQNTAVNRRITGTAPQGGNFAAGKIPTTTLQKNCIPLCLLATFGSDYCSIFPGNSCEFDRTDQNNGASLSDLRRRSRACIIPVRTYRRTRLVQGYF